MSWHMVASGAALTAVFLAPGLLWLSLTALPISGRVQATARRRAASRATLRARGLDPYVG